jgi:hypothetical protein
MLWDLYSGSKYDLRLTDSHITQFDNASIKPLMPAWGCDSVVEHFLPCMCKTPGLISNTASKQTKKLLIPTGFFQNLLKSNGIVLHCLTFSKTLSSY